MEQNNYVEQSHLKLHKYNYKALSIGQEQLYKLITTAKSMFMLMVKPNACI